MRALMLAMLLPFLACAEPPGSGHSLVVVEDWPGPRNGFPFGMWSLTWRAGDADLRALRDATVWREWAIAVGAERAEATRIERDGIRLVELGPPRPLTAAQLARMRELVASPRFGVRTACAPEPGVRVRFHRGAATADLLICYRCGHIVLAREGEMVMDFARWAGFGRERPALTGWARAVFPDEPAFREPVDRF
jgi:hypothetical protein